MASRMSAALRHRFVWRWLWAIVVTNLRRWGIQGPPLRLHDRCSCQACLPGVPRPLLDRQHGTPDAAPGADERHRERDTGVGPLNLSSERLLPDGPHRVGPI